MQYHAQKIKLSYSVNIVIVNFQLRVYNPFINGVIQHVLCFYNIKSEIEILKENEKEMGVIYPNPHTPPPLIPVNPLTDRHIQYISDDNIYFTDHNFFDLVDICQDFY